jgi:hypothetical protein
MGEEERLIINRMALVFPFRAVAMSTRRTHTHSTQKPHFRLERVVPRSIISQLRMTFRVYIHLFLMALKCYLPCIVMRLKSR